jgi:hypothetical protein
MLTGERSQTAQDFLAASDSEFAAGGILQGSEKLWGAAAHAVMAVSQQRGWRFGDHRALRAAANRLADELQEPILASNFSVAEKFHANFYHDFMQDFEIYDDRQKVRDFVNRVLSLPELPPVGC